METGKRVYRLFQLAFCLLFLWQFYLCIEDLMLHAVFVVSAGTVSYIVFKALADYRGYLWDLRIAYGSIITGVVLIFVVMIGSPKLFESIELFNGGIAYASVNWFGNDFHCVSNGRESDITKRAVRDIYLTKQQGKMPLLEHFKSMSEEEEEVRGDTEYFVLLNEEEEVLLFARRYQKNGYDIWKVDAIDEYRYKNIWGRVPKSRVPMDIMDARYQ